MRELWLMDHAAQWGYTQGLAAAQRLAAEERQRGADAWPEPITDRPPTEADADDLCLVQVQSHPGVWSYQNWENAAGESNPWHHTPRWRPPAPTLRERALRVLNPGTLQFAPTDDGGMILTAESVELIRKALEEAGDE